MVSVDWLFLDMNAFFASAEQQMQPALRGVPLVVVPTMTDRTCCIAVSYEARPYGIRTGTNVGEARRRCPGLRLVEGQHEHYVKIHQQIIAAVETVLPVEKVCSIDEMVCRLDPRHRPLKEAQRIAGEVKQAIARDAGPFLKCSIGLAPNRFLAKVASNLQKPDGLSVIAREELPRRLYSMELDDFPGIASNMKRHLASRGVRNTRQLCALSRSAMIEVWGSVVGAEWWHRLRGDECPERPTQRRTIGHSHMLPPKLRTEEGVRAVLVRLLHKAAARLRKKGYVACRLELAVSYTDGWPKWQARLSLGRSQDTSTMLKALDAAWCERSQVQWLGGGKPIKASVTLTRLEPVATVPRSLFAEERQALQAAKTMDAVNARLGSSAMYFASMHATRDAVPMRIAFTNIPEADPVIESKLQPRNDGN